MLSKNSKDKKGDRCWYEKNVPIADQLYDEHLKEINEENENV